MAARREKSFIPDSLNPMRSQPQHTLTQDEVVNESRLLLEQYVLSSLHNEPAIIEHGGPLSLEEIHDSQISCETKREEIHKITTALRKIGDELDRDAELQKLIAKVTTTETSNLTQVFSTVVSEVFRDNTVSWGRVVAVFYFAVRLIAKGIQRSISRQFSRSQWIREIINCVIQIIKDKLVSWIITRGGWGAVFEYFGTPSPQFYGICIGAFLTISFLAVWKNKSI